MRAKSFLTGVTAGIVGGAVAVLMTTPKPGQEIRSSLVSRKNVTQEHLGLVKHEISNVQQSFTSLSNEAKNNIPQIINEFKEIFVKFKNDIEPETTKLKQEIETLQNSINEIEKNLPKPQK